MLSRKILATQLLGLSTLAFQGACDDSSTVTVERTTREHTQAAPTAKSEASTPTAPTQAPLPLTSPRIFECDLSKDKTSIRLRNRTARNSSELTVWFYIYNGDKLLDRYAVKDRGAVNAGGVHLGDVPLGSQLGLVECEVSSVTFEDGSSWENSDFVIDSRPVGGHPLETLARRAKPVVEATWLNVEGRAKVRLHNTSSRPFKTNTLHLVYLDEEGTQIVNKSLTLREVELQPGETTDVIVNVSPSPNRVEVRMTAGDYLDGAKERWTRSK